MSDYIVCRKCEAKEFYDQKHEFRGYICDSCYEEELQELKEANRQYEFDKFQ